MSDKAPPLNLNSPEVKKTAKSLLLTVPEFVELSVLLTTELVRQSPGLFEGEGKSPSEHLNRMRNTMELVEQIRLLPPFERQKYAEQYPELKLNMED